MAVVAHPDDETFGCGSLLLHAAASGAVTTVVCATRGEAGEVASGVHAVGDIGQVREAELHAAAAVLGVGHVDLLTFADSGMDGETGPLTLTGAPMGEVVQAIRDAVDRHRPDVVIALDGSDGHRDHLRVRVAVENAVGSDVPLYLHCLPRSLMHAWVRHHMGEANAAVYTELPEIGTPDEEITHTVDTSAHLAAREAAIAQHVSQRSPFEGLPDDLRRAFLSREHLFEVNPRRASATVDTFPF